MSVLDDLRRGTLAGARAVSLAGLGLREMPAEVFALADTLEELDLADNHLTDLPHALSTLTRLKVLFGSRNPFRRLPPALGECPSLEQVGFRSCGLLDLPPEALPPRLRWLTLTDNRLTELPAELAARPRLQKLMLAGNRLHALPAALAGAERLELLRLSANRFEALPGWIACLPRLAWFAHAGNRLDAGIGDAAGRARSIPWEDLRLQAPLGEGASGRVFEALWTPGPSAAARAVAVKLFKGSMTSDGLPESEVAASLAAGSHPSLLGALGRVRDHPEGLDGLVMPVLPNGWRPLAGPPDRASCSRDVYSEGTRFTAGVTLRIAGRIAAAAAQLHAKSVLHGDLYAHNVLWDGSTGRAALGDFGAASIMPAERAPAFQRFDVLAWGILLGELLERCGDAADSGGPDLAEARRLQTRCSHPEPSERPTMKEVAAIVAGWARDP